MGETDGVHKRRVFHWSNQATELAREYKERANGRQKHSESDRRRLVTKLAEVSGNPRDACLRFLRELGVNQKRAYREWTKPEQQRLMDLVSSMPVEEAAKILRRPATSVRSMLHRLGVGGKTGREWFTKFSLSRALHTRPDEIQKWILARSLLQQPRILIVDEITSSLDAPSAMGLLHGLEHFRRARTLVVVSHRPSTILWADRILVVEDGAIVDSGKHGDLMRGCHAYRRIWQSQDCETANVSDRAEIPRSEPETTVRAC